MYNYGYNVPYGANYVTNSNSFSASGVWIFISLVVAIFGGILLYFTFLKPDNEKNYTGFTKKLYNFLSFKILSLETIFKISYLIIAIFITVSSFAFINESFLVFACYLVFGNIMARVCFELVLVLVLIYRRLSMINDKLGYAKKNNDKRKPFVKDSKEKMSKKN